MTPSDGGSSREQGAGHWPGRGRVRMRTMLGLGVLVPLLGMAAMATLMVAERWSGRAASITIERRSSELGQVLEVRADVADEEILSTLLALAATFGTDLAELTDLAVLPELHGADPRVALVEARSVLDGVVGPWLTPALDAALADLADLRDRVDDDTATFAEVSTTFAAVNAAVDAVVADQAMAIEAAADRTRPSARVRSSLRALRETVAAYSYAGPRITNALGISTSVDSADLVRLIDAEVRFAAAAERAAGSLGPRATEAWDRFWTEPAARRTEAVLARAVQVGIGEATSVLEGDPAELVATFADGARWAFLLTDTVHAASADMEAAAAAQATSDTRVMASALVAVLAVLAASGAVVVVMARLLVGPASSLEAAARQVGQGELDVTPVGRQGPREVAAVATAFNDMAATLRAVESHVVALASDPDASELEPLPGRTGQALQGAVDRLQSSIRLAEERRAELNVLATRDGLTGLMNRGAALEALERDLARAGRDGGAVFALFIDLDGLKVINDTLGHAAGDEALRLTADALRSTTRQADVVARIGGDEFIVGGLVREGPGEVAALAERVLAAVASRCVEPDGAGVPLRCSIGIATRAAGSVDQLLHDADSALYRAKGAGRGRAVWHRPDSGAPSAAE